jgi:hypothetical protein
MPDSIETMAFGRAEASYEVRIDRGFGGWNGCEDQKTSEAMMKEGCVEE